MNQLIIIGVFVAFSFFCILFVSVVIMFCADIHPVEQFSDLNTGIALAEKEVCTLITRADKFVAGNIGKPGLDNPELVVIAQQKARSGPIVPCAGNSTENTNTNTNTGDYENRLTRLENTLQSFTGPIIQHAYDTNASCEEFTNFVPTPEARLKKIMETIEFQQKRLLQPIDDKVAALQRGDLSDCERNKGANGFSKV